jgi:hypothetical protein
LRRRQHWRQGQSSAEELCPSSVFQFFSWARGISADARRLVSLRTGAGEPRRQAFHYLFFPHIVLDLISVVIPFHVLQRGRGFLVLHIFGVFHLRF